MVVEGCLTAPWASELESAWKRLLESGDNGRIVVDLSETTVIDASGKAILRAMVAGGAELVGKGVYTQHLVKSLVDKARHARCRF